jgi:hypothetical protein
LNLIYLEKRKLQNTEFRSQNSGVRIQKGIQELLVEQNTEFRSQNSEGWRSLISRIQNSGVRIQKVGEA